MDQCKAHWSETGERCPNPASHTMILGCRGEHIRASRLCIRCTVNAAQGKYLCRACLPRGIFNKLKAHKIAWISPPGEAR
jgi:hypothetical protein